MMTKQGVQSKIQTPQANVMTGYILWFVQLPLDPTPQYSQSMTAVSLREFIGVYWSNPGHFVDSNQMFLFLQQYR